MFLIARFQNRTPPRSDYVLQGSDPIIRILIVGVLAYAALVLMIRVAGKRLLSKMNAFDLVVTVALGEVAEVWQTVKGLVVNLPEVLFELDSAELKPQAQVMLQSIAKTLNSTEDLQISIEGHTDSTGSNQYNRELSRERALAVREFLVSQGISSETIGGTRGVGEADPIASNDTERGRQLNRRVEIIVEQLPDEARSAE